MSNNQSLSTIQQFQNLQLIITSDQTHGFLMSTEHVAKGYGISVKAIHNHKTRHPDEILENTHFIQHPQNVYAGNLPIKKLFWTRRGVIRLGMFIKSQRAIKFRDWAENLIIEKTDSKKVPAHPAVDLNFKDIHFKTITVSSQKGCLEIRGLEINNKLFLLQSDIYRVLPISTYALYKRRTRNMDKLIESDDYIRVQNVFWWNKECLYRFGYMFSIDVIKDDYRNAPISNARVNSIQPIADTSDKSLRERLLKLSKASKFLLDTYQLYIESKELNSGNPVYYPDSAVEGVESLNAILDEEFNKIIKQLH